MINYCTDIVIPGNRVSDISLSFLKILLYYYICILENIVVS